MFKSDKGLELRTSNPLSNDNGLSDEQSSKKSMTKSKKSVKKSK
jgi:hypothetical protein